MLDGWEWRNNETYGPSSVGKRGRWASVTDW